MCVQNETDVFSYGTPSNFLFYGLQCSRWLWVSYFKVFWFSGKVRGVIATWLLPTNLTEIFNNLPHVCLETTTSTLSNSDFRLGPVVPGCGVGFILPLGHPGKNSTCRWSLAQPSRPNNIHCLYSVRTVPSKTTLPSYSGNWFILNCFPLSPSSLHFLHSIYHFFKYCKINSLAVFI